MMADTGIGRKLPTEVISRFKATIAAPAVFMKVL
jgi:hypothetical protein